MTKHFDECHKKLDAGSHSFLEISADHAQHRGRFWKEKERGSSDIHVGSVAFEHCGLALVMRLTRGHDAMELVSPHAEKSVPRTYRTCAGSDTCRYRRMSSSNARDGQIESAACCTSFTFMAGSSMSPCLCTRTLTWVFGHRRSIRGSQTGTLRAHHWCHDSLNLLPFPILDWRLDSRTTWDSLVFYNVMVRHRMTNGWVVCCGRLFWLRR